MALMLLIQGCFSNTTEDSRIEKDEIRNIELSGWQNFIIADTIKITAPSNWNQIQSHPYTLREDCDNSFCGNMVCYILPNVGSVTRLKLGNIIVQNLNNNFSNFKLIHSEVSTPDSSMMSFDYLLTDKEEKLGGTTFIQFKGPVAIVFSFMGYNGNNGDYVTFRGKITKILDSIEYL